MAGISYLLFQGLNALLNKPQRAEPGKNFAHTLKKLTEEQTRGVTETIGR